MKKPAVNTIAITDKDVLRNVAIEAVKNDETHARAATRLLTQLFAVRNANIRRPTPVQ